jgi:hypothetical protein
VRSEARAILIEISPPGLITRGAEFVDDIQTSASLLPTTHKSDMSGKMTALLFK